MMFTVLATALASLASDEPSMSSLVVADTSECPALVWRTLGAESLQEDVIVLIHGLDEPGDIWNTLGPALERDGHSVLRFEYQDDGAISAASEHLIRALEDVRLRGVIRVTLIGHSMGGLVALDALTRNDGYAGDGTSRPDLPDVKRLITVATPFDGSPLAPWRAPLEIRDRAADLLQTPMSRWNKILTNNDGHGEAGVDLTPGSDFLRSLQSRGVPRNLAFTAIVARIGDEANRTVSGWIDGDLMRGALSDARVDAWMKELAAGANAIGDGVVSMQSACAIACADIVIMNATHRGVIRGLSFADVDRVMTRCDESDDPPAVREIVDRLKH